MFGQHHDEVTQTDQQMPTPDPMDDGMLGSLPMQGTPDPAPQDNDSASEPTNTIASQSFRQPMPDTTPAQPARTDRSAATTDDMGTADDLIGIKQQALQQLKPLVGHLEQTPEEKFRTTMMMIQAADDQSLINEAYEAAQKISDDKAKAQALLDVVNEINYFTSQNTQA